MIATVKVLRSKSEGRSRSARSCDVVFPPDRQPAAYGLIEVKCDEGTIGIGFCYVGGRGGRLLAPIVRELFLFDRQVEVVREPLQLTE